MKTENIKNIVIGFVGEHIVSDQDDVAAEFDRYVKKLKMGIGFELSELENGYCMSIGSLARALDADRELIRILLKELRDMGVVKLMRCFNEMDGMTAGSGHCLAINNL